MNKNNTVSEGTATQVRLTDITTSGTNQIFRDPADFTPGALKELIDSIREQGLIQPILVRPNKAVPHKAYILVAGERRYQASRLLAEQGQGSEWIPVYVRDLTDEQSFELQLTENLQRKDVHPMREARAYKIMQDQHEWTTAEIAARFGKGETYVLQRLRLNALIKEAADDFAAGDMTLGHALVIARLQPADQQELVKEFKRSERTVHAGPGGGKATITKYYEHVHELEDFIARHILNQLKSAPFDINDPDLVKAAGPCHLCSKQTGNQPLLFPGMAKADSCTDTQCFKLKSGRALAKKVEQLIEAGHEHFFVDKWQASQGDKVPAEITDMLKAAKITPLNSDNTQHGSYGEYKKKVSVMVLNGHQAGKKQEIYIKGKPAATPKNKAEQEAITSQDAASLIAGIKERTERAAEQDQEKVYARVSTLLTDEKAVDQGADTIGPAITYKAKDIKTPTGPLKPAELAMLRFQIVKRADKAYDKIEDKFGWDNSEQSARKQADYFMKMTDAEFVAAFREIIRQHDWLGQSTAVRTTEGQLMLDIARAWGLPVGRFEEEQAAIRAKREARAKERIEALKQAKKGAKEPAAKRPAKAKKSKPGKNA